MLGSSSTYSIPIRPDPIWVDRRIRCDSPAREGAGAAVEVQVVEPDAQQQLEPTADLAQHLQAGAGPAPARLDRAEEGVQLVEVQLAHLLDGLSRDGEQLPGGAQPPALAVGAGVLDHHLVQPLLHAGAGLAALPVAAVVALDPPGDAAEADRLALPVVALAPSPREGTGARSSSDRSRSGWRRGPWPAGPARASPGRSAATFARLHIRRPS